jgi:hypothetical protein
MRAVFFVAALVAAIWAIDAVVFDSHYSQVAWQDTKNRAQQFNYDVRYYLRKFGMVR